MTSGHKNPVAELVRDVHGTPVLYLFHLKDEQLRCLYDIMLVNSDSILHNIRSKARAHLSEFDTFDGRATIHLHGEDHEHYTRFKAVLSGKLGMVFPNTPIGDFMKTG